MSPSASLAAAAIAWVAFHIGVSGTGLRRVLVSRIGEGPFRGLFVLASIALLFWLGTAYGSAGPIALLWQAPRWLVVAGMWLLLPATLLLVCSLSQPNPTSVRGKRALEAEEPAVGILRITRHPMLWAFALWAVVHLVALGTVAAAWLAGAILVTALAGMPSLDAKYARRNPERWPRFAAATSIVPFVAIAQGRNRVVWREIGWWRPWLSVVLWGALIALHPLAFEVNPARYFHG
jgi:uncharacterized membrane protein